MSHWKEPCTQGWAPPVGPGARQGSRDISAGDVGGPLHTKTVHPRHQCRARGSAPSLWGGPALGGVSPASCVPAPSPRGRGQWSRGCANHSSPVTRAAVAPVVAPAVFPFPLPSAPRHPDLGGSWRASPMSSFMSSGY